MEPPHSSLLSADISRRNRWAARPRRVFLAILLAYLVLAVGYSVAVPLGEAPDEADHYAYIVYLGVHRALPQGSEVTQSKHPPLYHAAAAALTAWTGLDFTFLRSNPDALPLGPGKPPNFFVHTTLESFPWRGGALALHLARLLSVALGAVTLWATWRLGAEIFPGRPAIGLIAAAFLAGLPGFLFISGSANNDNAAGALGALTVLLCAMILTAGLRWRRTALLGIVLGLGLLAKVGTLALWPLAALAVGGVWWLGRKGGGAGPSATIPPLPAGPRPTSLRSAMAHLALAYGLGLLLAAPWWLRNWRLYGDPFGWELVRATVDQRVGPIGLAEALWLLKGFHPTFWGRFSAAGQVALPSWAYALAAICTLLMVVGVIRFLFRSGYSVQRPAFSVHLVLLAAAPLLMFISIYRYSAIALGTDQARLLWPALSAIAVWAGLGVVGLADWGKGRGRGGERVRGKEGERDGVLVAGFAVGMALFGLAALLGVAGPAYARPRALATEVAAAAPLARFGDLELIAVELPQEPLAVGQPAPVRLLWRAANADRPTTCGPRCGWCIRTAGWRPSGATHRPAAATAPIAGSRARWWLTTICCSPSRAAPVTSRWRWVCGPSAGIG
jgi:multisubunit Na+/H+ antiporter MnhF subunit